VATGPWHALYQGELQSLYALVVVPALFLLYLAAFGRGRAARSDDPQARFLLRYAVAFSAATILDPVATGPLARALELSADASRVLMIAFVLLGDWRVLLPVFALAWGPERRARAFAWSAATTLVVPISAFAIDALLRVGWPALPDQVLWLVYELGFLALALALRQRGLPRLAAGAEPGVRRALRAVLGYAATYYALWALADAIILAGSDLGWALRILPNQLYYAWTVPFVYFVCSARGSRLRPLIARK
jgi:hypothetical protein